MDISLQCKGSPLGKIDESAGVRLAHIRESRTQPVVVRTNEGIVADQIDVIVDDHHITPAILWVHPSAGIRDDEGFNTHGLHHAYRECYLLQGVAFVKVKATLHDHGRNTLDGSKEEFPMVRFNGRDREVGDVLIVDGRFHHHVANEATESGSKDHADTRKHRGLRAKEIHRFGDLFNEVGHARRYDLRFGADHDLTLFAATSMRCGIACVTCQELSVAGHVLAVTVGLCWAAAMPTHSHDAFVRCVIDLHTPTLIEDIALSVPVLAPDLRILAIGHNTAMELIDIREALFEHPSREFLTANATGAVGKDGLVLRVGEMFADPRGKLPERGNIGPDGTAKMSKVVLVIRAPVQDDDVFSFHLFAPLFRRKVRSGTKGGIMRMICTKGHQFRLCANEDLAKDVIVALVDLEHHIGKSLVGMHCLHVPSTRLTRPGCRPIDALGGDENASTETQFLAKGEVGGGKGGGVVDGHEFVIQEDLKRFHSTKMRTSRFRKFVLQQLRKGILILQISRPLCVIVVMWLAAATGAIAQLVEQSYRYSALEERSVRHLIDDGMIRRAHASLRMFDEALSTSVRDVVPFDRADVDRGSDNRSAAERQMKTFLRSRPNSPAVALAWMERGVAAMEDGDDKATADLMGQAAGAAQIDRQRRSDTLYRTIEHECRFWQAAAMARLGMYGEALAAFHQCIDADTAGAYADRSWYAIGQLFEQNRQFDSAIVAFRIVRERYPRGSLTLAARIREAQNVLVLRQPERTLDILSATSTIDRSTQLYAQTADEQIMVLRAEATAMRGMAQQAHDSCEAFLQRYPTSIYRWYVHLDAGSTALQLGAYGVARDHYRTVIDSLADESSSLRQLALLYHAVALKRMGSVAEAIVAFQTLSLQTGYPYQAQALLELGQCYYEEGDFERAKKQLERAERESRDAVTSIRTMLVLGATYIEQGLWTKAASTYERAEQLAQAGTDAFMPDKDRYLAESRLKRGICFVQANQMRSAIGALTDFLGNHPNDARRDEATFWLAEAMYRNDLLKNAQELYEEVINRFTASARREEAMYGLAWTYFRRRDFERSVQRFGEMAQAFPKSRFVSDALARRGDGFYIMKQYHAAAEAYRDAARRGPGTDEGQYAAFQVGQALYRSGDLDAAQRSMRDFAERYPKSGLADDALFVVGWIYFQQHQYAQAITALQEVLSVYPNGDQAVRALYTIADAQYNNGDLETCLETYRQVISRFPSHPLAFEATKSMQFALVGLGRTDEALIVADAYITANPQSSGAETLTRTKAEIFYSGKNYASAAQELEAFMKKYPSAEKQDESLFLLGKTYLNMNEIGQARTAFTDLERRFARSPFVVQSKLELAGYYNKAANSAAADSLYGIIMDRFVDDTATASEAGFERAMMQKLKGDSIRAIATFETIADRYPGTEYGDQSRYQVAMYYRKNKQYDSARAHFAGLAERVDNPGLAAEALYRIGELYIREKQTEPAIPYFKKVREEFAGAEDWYTLSMLALGECYEATKQPDLAKDVYRVVSELRPDDDYGKAAGARLKRMLKQEGKR